MLKNKTGGLVNLLASMKDMKKKGIKKKQIIEASIFGIAKIGI